MTADKLGIFVLTVTIHAMEQQHRGGFNLVVKLGGIMAHNVGLGRVSPSVLRREGLVEASAIAALLRVY